MYASQHFVARFLCLLFALLIATTTAAQTQPRSHDRELGPIAPLAALLLRSDIHAALALSAAQEAQWSALQTADQALRAQRDAARAKVQALIAAEFADPLPDLAAIESAIMVDQQTTAATIAAISTQAIALYSGLSTAQQAIVITFAKAHYQRASPR